MELCLSSPSLGQSDCHSSPEHTQTGLILSYAFGVGVATPPGFFLFSRQEYPTLLTMTSLIHLALAHSPGFLIE